MILNTGCRSDIPAFFSRWFYNRIQEGYVCTRNPYVPKQVLRYILDPQVVDILCFCTKNPEPMLDGLKMLDNFRQFWFVTLTPYGKDVEPMVGDKRKILESIKRLSGYVGVKKVAWRYDPIFVTEKYSLEYHLRAFEKIASMLQGHVSFCVISFLDLYEKTKRNFPQAKAVTNKEQIFLALHLSEIGRKYGIPIRSCCEASFLSRYGIETQGCMTKEVLEEATNIEMTVPKSKKPARSFCNCLLGSDIGMYNTCRHGCLYCYANYDRKTVEENLKHHDPNSPLLIGRIEKGDKIIDVKQESYLSNQISLF